MGLPRRVRRYVGVAAEPDTASLARLDTIVGAAGASLHGRNTHVIGVDRGDPTRSLTGPLNASPSPARAVAEISAGQQAGYRPTPIMQDNALTNPELDPYNALLLQRMRGAR